MFRIFTLVLITLISFGAVRAQDGYPLPDDLQPITPANAAQIHQLASVGGDLPGALAWSPDGKLLMVGTSAGVKIYDADDLSKSPLVIQASDYQNIGFDHEGYLYTNTQWWDASTGEAIENPFQPAVKHYDSPDGKIEAVPANEDGQLIIQLVNKADSSADPLVVLHTGVMGQVTGIVFSPDGSKIGLSISQPDPQAEADEEIYPTSTIQLWDVSTNTMIESMLGGYGVVDFITFIDDGQVFLYQFDTDPEGYGLLAYAFFGGLDARTGKALFGANIGQPSSMQISSKGAVAYGGSGALGLWTESKLIGLNDAYYDDSEGTVGDFSFSPDGSLFAATGSGQKQILLWDMDRVDADGKASATLDSESSISHFFFSRDGKWLAAVESGGTRVWDVQKREQVSFLENAYATTFSPSGLWLKAGVNSPNTSAIWDVKSGKEIISFPYNTVLNSDWLRVAYWDVNSIHIVDTATGKDIEMPMLSNYTGYATGLDGRTAQAIFGYGNIQSYDLLTSNLSYQLPGKSFVMSVTSGSVWAVEDSKGEISIWDTQLLKDSNTAPRASFNPQAGPILMTLSSNGALLATWERSLDTPGSRGEVQLWDTQNGTLLTSLVGDRTAIGEVVFSPDDHWLVADDMVWDVDSSIKTGKGVEKASVMDFPDCATITNMVFSPNSQYLAVFMVAGCADATEPSYLAGIWDFSHINLQHPARMTIPLDTQIVPNSLYGLQPSIFNTDGSLVTAGSGLWDTASGKQISPIGGSVSIFSPDGGLLVTYGNDIALWDVSALLEGEETPLAVLQIADMDIKELAFSPDGTLLFARSTNRVSVWGVPGV